MELIDFQKQFIPNKIDETLLHQDKINFIKRIKNLSNIMFYGYEGKTILINLLIKNIYPKIILNKFEFKIKKINYNCYHSNYHIEINILTLSNKEKNNLFELIKEYSYTKSIINIPYKIIVIYNFDKLNKKIQFKFRSIMEKITSNIRFILHVNEYTKVIEPIRSRCIHFRIPSVKNNELIKFIKIIIKKYNYKINKIDNFINDYKENGVNSISKILNILYLKIELNKVKMRYKIKDNNELNDLYKNLISEKEPFKKIEITNELLINILQKNIEPIKIYKFLLNKLIENNDIKDKYELIKKTCFYEYFKNREIINLESYLVYLIMKISE